ncbi:hypothetical protein AAFF_G00075750 [Aldrovandia affinis]|uniref:Nidogen n=1 Tax=Aldrovandia affinis TaxID=143900 RepID=A0AAD7RYC1_9TELE|nr:hypothetical protein AAFF_G00075750 [Aldrovandia affinis]
MGVQRRGLLLWISLLALVAAVSCLSRSDLFQYGTKAGDGFLDPGTDQTTELGLDKSMYFYDGSFDSVFINTNGFIGTAEPTAESEYLGKMPASFGMVAALLGDLDTSDGVGRVYFRQDSSPAALQLATEYITRAFPKDNEVEPIHTVVVTWENVARREPQSRGDGRDRKRNTFQLVVASMDTASYAILLYPREGMQFLSTTVGGDSEPIEAGFSKGLVRGWFRWSSRQGPYYRITTSDEASVRELTESTNAGTPWHVGVRDRHLPLLHRRDPRPADRPAPPRNQPPQGRPWERTNVEEEEEEEEEEGEEEQEEEVEEEAPVPEAPEVTVTPGPRKVPYEVVDPDEGPTETGPPEQPYGEPVPVHPVQFQPQQPRYQPENPQVVVVDEGVINVDVFSYNFETCAKNRNKCSTLAECRDHASGYCCHCKPGYYGNGKHCVAEGKPQRMNGKVSGRVFVGNSRTPMQFNNNDLHSYVVANDGRAYVAISTVPADLGPSLLPLSSLGGVIGWAFALEQPGYQNASGSSLKRAHSRQLQVSEICGEFTRQAEVTFLPGNEKLTIKQEFKGIDEHDHLAVNTEVEGRLPEVPAGSTVLIDAYTEIYQYSSNTITSTSTRDYTVALSDGSTQTKSFQWRQSIVFQSCQHDEATRAAPSSQQLNVDQIFVMYDPSNQLIRYAMSNKIGSIHGRATEQNPCFTGRHGCDTSAACRPGQGNQFTCECAIGFTGDGKSCYDIDECRESPQICGRNAICINQPGSHRCECVEGFQFAGDGLTCHEEGGPIDHCQAGTHNCDIPQRAQCSYTGGSAFICSCLPGFVGDGRACQDIDECQPGRCHQEAVCYNTQGSFNCQCKPGFQGDGFHCSSVSPAEREKTQCERQRESALASSSGFGAPRRPRPIPGLYVPACDAQGRYEPMQCHGSVGQCWCVDRVGKEVPGTRTGHGSRPMCIDQSVPPPVVGPTPRPDVSPLPSGSHLLFAQSGRIEHIPLEGQGMKKSEAKTLLHLPDRVVIGVAYDCVEKMVYWTEISGPSISKASLQGGDPVPVIRADLESPEGIAIDHLSRTMFWTDSMRDRIEVASLDGTKRRVLFDTDLVNPRPIVTDPTNGHLYWADWNRDGPKIEASYMDGTNRRTLVKDNLGLPNGLTFDPQTSLLCWADAGTRKVECMTPSQSDRRKIMEGIQYPFGVSSYGRNLYYTDWRRDAVVAVDRSTGKETDEFLPQRRSRIYGITTANAQCPTGQNYCSVNNGGCTHLCLPTPAGRSCLCPDNAVGVSCVERQSSLAVVVTGVYSDMASRHLASLSHSWEKYVESRAQGADPKCTARAPTAYRSAVQPLLPRRRRGSAARDRRRSVQSSFLL